MPATSLMAAEAAEAARTVADQLRLDSEAMTALATPSQ